MIDFLLAIADTPRPDVKDIEAIWKRSQDMECTRKLPEALSNFNTVLTQRLSANGKAIAIQCTLPDKKALSWFASRGRLSEIDFFYEVFRSKSFQKTLGDVDNLIPAKIERQFKPKRRPYIAESGYGSANNIPVKEDIYRFKAESCFTQIGMLASDAWFAKPTSVVSADVQIATSDTNISGASSDATPEGARVNGRDILHDAVTAGDAMLVSGYENGLCYNTPVAWAPWFSSIQWDRTYVFIDKASRKASFLMMTDTD